MYVTIIVGTSNNFITMRLPMQRREQKLLRFGWSAPDFTPKMSLAWAIPNLGDGFHSEMLQKENKSVAPQQHAYSKECDKLAIDAPTCQRGSIFVQKYFCEEVFLCGSFCLRYYENSRNSGQFPDIADTTIRQPQQS